MSIRQEDQEKGQDMLSSLLDAATASASLAGKEEKTGRLAEMRMDLDLLAWVDDEVLRRRSTRSQVVREALALAQASAEAASWERDPRRIVAVPGGTLGTFDVIGPRQGAFGADVERATEVFEAELRAYNASDARILAGVRQTVADARPESLFLPDGRLRKQDALQGHPMSLRDVAPRGDGTFDMVWVVSGTSHACRVVAVTVSDQGKRVVAAPIGGAFPPRPGHATSFCLGGGVNLFEDPLPPDTDRVSVAIPIERLAEDALFTDPKFPHLRDHPILLGPNDATLVLEGVPPHCPLLAKVWMLDLSGFTQAGL